jgi:hypothetical protein
MKGIKKSRKDLNALGHYMFDDGRVYMAMNNKCNSKRTIITKEIHSVRHELRLGRTSSCVRTSYPGWLRG